MFKLLAPSLLVALLPFMFGFTILSGVNEAKLPATPESPEVVFYWDGTAPKINGKDEFEGGRYAELDDVEFMSNMLQAAFDVWNDVKGSYLKMKVERREGIKVEDSDKQNAIVVDDPGNYAAAAFAKPIFNEDYDTIEDCDITVGDSSVSAKDLGFILAHEIGHCVGLGHNHTNRRAMMGYTRPDYNLYLSADDKAGIIYLYTDPEFKGEHLEFLACAAIKSGGANTGIVLIGLILLPLVLINVRRICSVDR